MTQPHPKPMNGVDVPALFQTIQAIKQNPALGRFEFRADNHWLGGTRNRSTIQNFYGAGHEDTTRAKPYIMDCDEPPVLTGHDQGANPVEYLLNALAGCVTTTMTVHAASRGMKIEKISSHLDGDIDVQGFMGLSNQVPRGYKAIRMTIYVKSDAPVDQLKALAEYSPVYNTLINPTPVEINVVKAS